MENQRLQNELQLAKRQASERALRYFFNICCLIIYCNKVINNIFNYRIQALESELSSRRQLDHSENADLEKAMEQVEDNLKRSTVS